MGFFWAWLLFACMFVSIFLYLLHCALFFWPRVCPFTPESLAFAAGVSKLRHAGAKHVQKKKEYDRKREGEEGSRANYDPEKTKGHISMIPPAVLFMSCVLSLPVTFTSTLALSEGKQAKMPWCSIFHFPLVLSLFFFLHEVAENTVYFRFLIYVLSYFFFQGLALLVPHQHPIVAHMK